MKPKLMCDLEDDLVFIIIQAMLQNIWETLTNFHGSILLIVRKKQWIDREKEQNDLIIFCHLSLAKTT